MEGVLILLEEYTGPLITFIIRLYLNTSDTNLTLGASAAILSIILISLLTRRGAKPESAERQAGQAVLSEAETPPAPDIAAETKIIEEPPIRRNIEPEIAPAHEPAKRVEPIAALTQEASPVALEGEPEPEVEIEKEPEETKDGLFSRLRAGLARTQSGLLGKLDEILSIRKEVDENLWDEFEETLIMSDLGMPTTMKLRDTIEGRLTKKSLRDPKTIKAALKEEILKILRQAEGRAIEPNRKPFVIMVAGVNGVGKTTTIGKLAYKFRKDGKSVMVAAADTFRAAAVDQLEVWAKRVGSDFLRGQNGADPSAVAFDAVKAASSRGTDVLIIDTAGRLHTKTNLMDELKKIRKIVAREMDGAPHETLLVLDATTGQNAVQQAKIFRETVEVTGIALTKLDGTAKGGVIVSIANELNIPVKFIGIGESLGDLREFKAEEFVEALFLSGSETLH
ncbi:MAG: signal recognition particle-docking protein FtsY [Deltaproteobacteria bacterium]